MSLGDLDSRVSVLLVAHTRLSLGYLRDYQRLLTTDRRICFSVTRARDDYSAGVDTVLDELGMRRLPYCVAVRREWDLALFATHGSEIFFQGAATRAHIQHGLGAGKLVNGQDFTYGPKWALWEGRPKFDAMFEASHAVAARARAACPPLKNRIIVVGDIRADRVLAAAANRRRYRAQLGLAENEVAVLVISTFGPHGMLGRYGLAYLDQALSLGAPYRVLLTMHPHLWTGRHDNRLRLGAALDPRRRTNGLVVCGPDDDFVPYLAAADIAVTDHSSLGLYWALLARPTVTVPVPSHVINLAAPIAALRAGSPLAGEPAELRDALDRATHTFDPRLFAPHRRTLVSNRGRAAETIRGLLYRLLDLTTPGP